MADQGTPTHRFEARADAASHFAWLRTRMALERTLMAWVRTAVSLIGFGFTVVQFFERFRSMDRVTEALRPEAPRYLGLSLIAAGVLALLISTWQYRVVVRYTLSTEFEAIAGIEAVKVTPLYAISIVKIFIGLFAFVTVYIRAL